MNIAKFLKSRVRPIASRIDTLSIGNLNDNEYLLFHDIYSLYDEAKFELKMGHIIGFKENGMTLVLFIALSKLQELGFIEVYDIEFINELGD